MMGIEGNAIPAWRFQVKLLKVDFNYNQIENEIKGRNEDEKADRKC